MLAGPARGWSQDSPAGRRAWKEEAEEGGDRRRASGGRRRVEAMARRMEDRREWAKGEERDGGR